MALTLSSHGRRLSLFITFALFHSLALSVARSLCLSIEYITKCGRAAAARARAFGFVFLGHLIYILLYLYLRLESAFI